MSRGESPRTGEVGKKHVEKNFEIGWWDLR